MFTSKSEFESSNEEDKALVDRLNSLSLKKGKFPDGYDIWQLSATIEIDVFAAYNCGRFLLNEFIKRAQNDFYFIKFIIIEALDHLIDYYIKFGFKVVNVIRNFARKEGNRNPYFHHILDHGEMSGTHPSTMMVLDVSKKDAKLLSKKAMPWIEKYNSIKETLEKVGRVPSKHAHYNFLK